MSRSAKWWVLLGLAIGPACAAGLPPEALKVGVVQVASPASLTLRLPDGERRPIVLGELFIPGKCHGEAARAWAERVLGKVKSVHFVPTPRADGEASGNGRLYLVHGGEWVDYALLAVRSGNAVLREASSVDAQKVFAEAERDARAERRGLWRNCESPLRPFEAAAEKMKVPPAVLYGLAMNESRYGSDPWPWTLNIAGRGYFYETRYDAWRAAETLLKSGFRMFDIGSMQVNWRYHGHRFASTWEALEPSVNREVGAQILRENYEATGNMLTAVGRYHSGNPERARAYQQRFLTYYRKVKAKEGETE